MLKKPKYYGFVFIKVSKTQNYCNDKNILLPCFGQRQLQLQYTDCDTFANSKRINDLLSDSTNLRTLENIF